MSIEINRLNSIDTLEGGDQLAVWDTSNGDTRKASASVLLSYMQANLNFTNSYITQYSAPSATAFNVAIASATSSTHLILTTTAGFAAGTITLPAGPVDKQELLVNCTQAVTTLTIDGGSNTVTGAPASLSANDFFRLKYDAVTDVWYRVG